MGQSHQLFTKSFQAWNYQGETAVRYKAVIVKVSVLDGRAVLPFENRCSIPFISSFSKLTKYEQLFCCCYIIGFDIYKFFYISSTHNTSN